MAAFESLDWRRIDVTAIVGFAGIATIEPKRADACRTWLRNERYEIRSFDCSKGTGAIVLQLAQMLDWQKQFGYELEPDCRNLDAMRDGLSYLETNEEFSGTVLEFSCPESIPKEDSEWFKGLLAIIQEQSRRQLALGNRLFALLVLSDDKSPLIGQVIDQAKIPGPFWDPCKEIHEFNL